MYDYVEGSGLWRKYVDKETGDSSIKEHKLKLVKSWCPSGKHVYDETIPPNRQIECKACGQETTFIVGYHELVNGHLRERQK